MEFDDIERILELMRQHDLSEFELEREGLKLRVRKTSSGYAPLPAPMQMPSRRPLRLRGRHRPCPESRARRRRFLLEEPEMDLAVVKSPIVGTFYRSPEPGAASFVEVGDRRQEGPGPLHHRGDEADERDHVGVRRRAREPYVENGQPVQYGERLFAIKTTKCSRRF